MHVEQTRDRDRLRAFLEQDRGWGAYALGDLEPPNFEQTDWYLSDAALCLVFRGLNPPPLFFTGDSVGVAALLDVVDVTPAYLNVRREHLTVVAARYQYNHLAEMWRMVLSRDRFRPETRLAVRLKETHLADLRRLYARAFGGDAFAAFQLHDGFYFGVFEDGHLVSAAGTHVVGPAARVAAVGNVATLPEYRNRGYARATTSAVCSALLTTGIETIVLNVHQTNAPAVRAYRHLGFETHCEFLEGSAILKAHKGVRL